MIEVLLQGPEFNPNKYQGMLAQCGGGGRERGKEVVGRQASRHRGKEEVSC